MKTRRDSMVTKIGGSGPRDVVKNLKPAPGSPGNSGRAQADAEYSELGQEVHDMALDGASAKKNPRSELSGKTAGDSDQIDTIDISQIRMHPDFVDLLRIDPKLLARIVQDMREHGYYPSKPVVLGWWPGLDEPVLIDGHARIQAAGEEELPTCLL